MKKYRPEDISRDRATSSWMPRAEARGVARGAKKKKMFVGDGLKALLGKLQRGPEMVLSYSIFSF